MTDIIVELNSSGYETSGCCIGDNYNKAWIIIQEINENKMIALMKKLNGVAYNLEKSLYLNSKGLYVHYCLSTPICENVDNKNKIINSWIEKLKTIKDIDFDKQYECHKMKELFN